MLRTGSSLLILLTVLGRVTAGPMQARSASAAPTVQLDSATVTGFVSDSGSSRQFLGIPFAQPPTGNLRFQVPQKLPPYNASFSALKLGRACSQQSNSGPDIPITECFLLPPQLAYYNSSTYGESGEDCLTLNVVTPSSANPTSRLPVLVSIFGGGFQVGSATNTSGVSIVEKSVSLGESIIYVNMNHRLSAFGFLASQEVKDVGVGNLGLRDQRMALEWVNQYISAFGGDPAKVTIEGISSGAISASLQMLTNGGDSKGLFRAAFMESGAPIPVGDITNGQKYYDFLVEKTNCSGAKDTTLQCLRDVPYEKLMDAVNETPNIFSYESLVLAWLPRVDGDFLTDNPQQLVKQGSVADIPFVSGNADDEGTVFSFSTRNITEDEELKEYLQTYWLPNASADTIDELMTYYLSDPAEGSPFDTGNKSAITPQFKRIAAFQGDAVFQGPRRFFLQNRSGMQNIWSYAYKRYKWLPCFGSFHGSDALDAIIFDEEMSTYMIRFVAKLDPNAGETENLYWPQYKYGKDEKETMLAFMSNITLFPPNVTRWLELTTDTYRANAMEYLTNVTLANPI